jgi:DoxX-like family
MKDDQFTTAPMHTQTTKTFQHMTDEKLATHPRSRWHRIRIIAFWATTFVVVFELAAGSVWNLLQIEWIRVQLHHLGYPLYFSTISGVWQAGGAAAIIAPGFPRLKEWAYAGAFFTWSGAVASHLAAGDSAESWVTPLVFAIFAILSWALRPADRRLPNAGVAPETRPLAWAVPLGILLLLYVVSYLTLPAVNTALHKRADELGWLREYEESMKAR